MTETKAANLELLADHVAPLLLQPLQAASVVLSSGPRSSTPPACCECPNSSPEPATEMRTAAVCLFARCLRSSLVWLLGRFDSRVLKAISVQHSPHRRVRPPSGPLKEIRRAGTNRAKARTSGEKPAVAVCAWGLACGVVLGRALSALLRRPGVRLLCAEPARSRREPR
jgi:hypothetical protein